MSKTLFRILLKSQIDMWELLASDGIMSPITIGTSEGCDFRLLEVPGVFSIQLERTQEGWRFCNPVGAAVYIRNRDGSARLLNECMLENRLRLSICVDQKGALRETLSIQVEEIPSELLEGYDQRVSLAGRQQFSIGGTPNSTIRLKTEYTQGEQVVLLLNNGFYDIQQTSGNRNVYINVSLMQERGRLRGGDFLTIGDVRLWMTDSSVYLSQNALLGTDNLPSIPLKDSESSLEYPIFIRSTRIQHQVEMDEIVIDQPAASQKPEDENLILRLMPTLSMMLTMVVMRGMMGGGINQLGMAFYVLVSMGSSLGVMFFTRRENKRKALNAEKDRKNRYFNYVKQKIEEITERRQDELRILNRIYRSTDDNLNVVRNFSCGLFDRSPEDSDFLDIRLGHGERKAVITVRTNDQEYRQKDDELVDMALDVVNRYKMLNNAPVVARLNMVGAIGVVGQRKWLYEMLKSMTVDITVRHYYKEVKLFFVIDEEDQGQFQWVRWLRNCFDAESGTYRSIMCDEESTKVHLEVLYRILSERASVAEDKRMVWSEYYVIFVYRVEVIRNHPISKYFEICSPLGVRFVFMDEHEERIPRGCAQLIRLDRRTSAGNLIQTVSGDVSHHFEYTTIMDEWMKEVVNKLSRVEVVESNLANEMTKSITLFELLGIQRPSDVDIEKLWKQTNVEKSLAVPLGVKTKNSIQYLDIHEKAHGPHGLVAGTTGSGKSEILQSYLINLALYFRPEEVNFLLIDFKGGGMSNLFTGLPHLAGSITDIDGREIARSLKSIRAELERRKELFAKAKVNRIDAYIKEYRAGNIKPALPHLIIVVDEFAELKAEQPDFMKELVSTARVGRSLGVHLILATQKPSGVVDAQIWSNSRFRMCLKVATKEDSNEMIKTPLAAEIREPGRAYLQVGNNELFELFQSGYSGGGVPNVDPNAVHPFTINELNMWGKTKPVYKVEAKKTSSGEEKREKSQLEALVEYVTDFCTKAGVVTPPLVCMPPLPAVIYAADVQQQALPSRDVVIWPAVYDDPEKHYQGPYEINLTNNHVFITGSAQMGKTMALVSMVHSVVMHYSPMDVNFYMIDAGTMTLKMFENSKFVGGVADVHEEDLVNNMMKMFRTELMNRRSKMMEKGVGTYDAYLETGAKDMPLMVLMIDNIAAFREYYENQDETIQTLGREGLSVGISLVFTGNASNNLSYRISSTFSVKICLTNNDVTEYSSINGSSSFEPHNRPGCGLAPLDKRTIEIQFALPLKADSEREMREMVIAAEEERERAFTAAARRVPLVPKELRLADVMRQQPELFRHPYEMVLGMEYSTVETLTYNLEKSNNLVISGRPHSGKLNMVKNILTQIQKNVFVHRTDIFILDGPKRSLYAMREMGSVKEYTIESARMRELIKNLHETARKRQEVLFDREDGGSGNDADPDWPLQLLVINEERTVRFCQEDKECSRMLYEILEMYAGTRVSVIWCHYPNVKAGGFSATDLQKHIGADGTFLFFDALSELRLGEVTLQMLREMRRPVVCGDAFWHQGDDFHHIKTLLAE